MKKYFALMVVIFIVFSMNAQNVYFYINNGTKQVTTVDFKGYSDLKIKFKLPQTSRKYDEISVRVYSDEIDLDETIQYIVDKHTSDWYSAWILAPNKQRGDFNIDSTDLFVKPTKAFRIDKFTLYVEVLGYYKTGTETYFDEDRQAWRTKPTWDYDYLAKDSLVLTGVPLITTYKSKDGIISGTFADPKTCNFSSNNYSCCNIYQISYFTDKYNKYNYSSVDVDFLLIPKSELSGSDEENYQFIKDDILAEVGENNLNVNFHDYQYNSLNAFFASSINHFSTHFLPSGKSRYCNPDFDVTELDKKHKGVNGLLADWTPKPYTNPDLWTKKTLGGKTFDYLHVDNYHRVLDTDFNPNTRKFERELSKEAGKLDVYTLNIDDYYVIIYTIYYDDDEASFFPYNYDKQIKLVEKTLENVNFK